MACPLEVLEEIIPLILDPLDFGSEIDKFESVVCLSKSSHAKLQI